MWAASSARSSVGSKGTMSLVRSAARRWRTRKLGPTPQVIAKRMRVWSFAGPATPRWTGSVMPAARRRPAQATTGAASKQNWVAIAIRASVSRWKAALAASAARATRSPPVAVDVAVALRVAGDVEVGEAVGVEEAGAEELERLGVGAPRGVDAAGDDERLGDAGLGIGGDARFRARRGRRCRGPGSAA